MEKFKSFLHSVFISSTGQGLAKRWESGLTLLLPILLIIAPDVPQDQLHALGNELGAFVDAAKTVVAAAIGVWKTIDHIYGWARAKWNKENKLGKFAVAAQ